MVILKLLISIKYSDTGFPYSQYTIKFEVRVIPAVDTTSYPFIQEDKHLLPLKKYHKLLLIDTHELWGYIVLHNVFRIQTVNMDCFLQWLKITLSFEGGNVLGAFRDHEWGWALIREFGPDCGAQQKWDWETRKGAGSEGLVPLECWHFSQSCRNGRH